MAGSVNKVVLIGNLGRDPEVRHTLNGSKIVHLSVATSETWKDKVTGERKDKTEWHRVVIFNEHLNEIAEQYLRKGSKIYLEGQLQTRKWTNQEGQENYTTEVVIPRFKGELTMLDSKNSSEGDNRFGPPVGSDIKASNGETDSIGNAQIPDLSKELEDEIPF